MVARVIELTRHTLVVIEFTAILQAVLGFSFTGSEPPPVLMGDMRPMSDASARQGT